MRTFTAYLLLYLSLWGVAFPPREVQVMITYVLEGELDVVVLQGKLHAGHHGLLHLYISCGQVEISSWTIFIILIHLSSGFLL
jgi:hypothetical protein